MYLCANQLVWESISISLELKPCNVDFDKSKFELMNFQCVIQVSLSSLLISIQAQFSMYESVKVMTCIERVILHMLPC